MEARNPSERALAADRAAEAAMKEMLEFREANRAYFSQYTHILALTGAQKRVEPALDRQMNILRERAANLNKIALDIEYEEEILPQIREYERCTP